MRTFSQLGRYVVARTKSLEIEFISARRELSALRNDYLELGLKASMLAGERDTAIAARKKTEAYIAFVRPDCEIEAEGGNCIPVDPGVGRGIGNRLPGHTSPADSVANSKQHAGWNALDTLKEYVTPRSLRLEAGILSTRRELASLGDDYLELAERTNTIACERDTALVELGEAQDVAEILMPGHGVNLLNDDQARDAIAEDASDWLAVARDKLNKTQAEKNDASIKLAESEDLVAELRQQAAQLHEEVETLEKRLSSSANENTAAIREIAQLTDELDKARILAVGKKELLDGELLRVRNEHAEDRRGDQQYIEDLEQRLAELEPALLAANRTIEDLKQSLADVSYRQKYMGKHTTAPSSEPDEGAGQQKNSLNSVHGRIEPAAEETTVTDRQASKFGWTRIVAGFVFVLGVLASGVKIWSTDLQNIYRAETTKDVDTSVVGQQDTNQSGIVRVPPEPPETVALASLDIMAMQPTEAVNQSGKDVKPASQPRDFASGNTGAKRTRMTARTRGRGGHVRAYLMEANKNIDSLYELCIREGVNETECALLDKNMFEEGVVRLSSGVQYTVIRNGAGASPGPDDTVLVNFRAMLLDGSEFDSSGRHGGASRFRVDEAIPGLQDVLQYMEEGAKWEVYIPTNLAFKKPAAFGGQTVVFELELISIEDTQGLKGESEAAQDNTETTSISGNPGSGQQFTHDETIVAQEQTGPEAESTDVPLWEQVELRTKRFLEENATRRGVVSLPSGLQYKVLESGGGRGRSPLDTDTVTLNYRGVLLDGSEIDSSHGDGESVTFTMKEVIPGWQEALLQMEEGDKWVLYIPPDLSRSKELGKLGARGQQALIYEVELVGIK